MKDEVTAPVYVTGEAEQEAWLADWFERRGLRDYRAMEPGPERDAHKRECFRLMYTPGVHRANIPEFPPGVEAEGFSDFPGRAGP